MKEVFYSEKPSVFQTYENGEVQYRWDIEEVISDNEENNISQWKCKEVTINSPIDKEQLTRVVITSIWDSDLEKKLINDYNGAKAGLFDTAAWPCRAGGRGRFRLQPCPPGARPNSRRHTGSAWSRRSWPRRAPGS